ATIASFIIATKCNRKKPSPLTLPVLLATFQIVVLLLIFNIPFETYMIVGVRIDQLLGPVVVAVPYPRSTQREIIKQIAAPMIIGIFTGALVGITTGILFTKLIGFDDVIIYSLSPKSVTTPVAMDIASSIGGIPPLAVVFVMIAGIGGGVMSSFV